MAVEYIDTGNDDGIVFGRSDGKIGFYGLGTPVAQQTITVAASVTASIGELITDFHALMTQLEAIGIITWTTG